jgi:meiotic recombination protein SPO11
MSSPTDASKKASPATAAKRKRQVVTLAKDADVVLKRVRKLRDDLVRNSKMESDDSEGKPRPPANVLSDILEVSDLPNAQVIEAMEAIAARIATQVLGKKGLTLEVPSRASSNQIYVKEWDRIVLGGKTSARNFLNVRESRKTAITVRVMQLLHTGKLEEPKARAVTRSVMSWVCFVSCHL